MRHYCCLRRFTRFSTCLSDNVIGDYDYNGVLNSCNNDVVSSVNSKLSYSKCCIYESSEKVRLTNVLFSQIMKDKSLDECNTDLKKQYCWGR